MGNRHNLTTIESLDSTAIIVAIGQIVKLTAWYSGNIKNLINPQPHAPEWTLIYRSGLAQAVLQTMQEPTGLKPHGCEVLQRSIVDAQDCDRNRCQVVPLQPGHLSQSQVFA